MEHRFEKSKPNDKENGIDYSRKISVKKDGEKYPSSSKRSRWKFNLPWQQWFSSNGKSDSHRNPAQYEKQRITMNFWLSWLRQPKVET